jgi:hypothetical protein
MKIWWLDIMCVVVAFTLIEAAILGRGKTWLMDAFLIGRFAQSCARCLV